VVGTDDSATARESERRDFDNLAVRVGRLARENSTRAKGLAAAVRYHGVDITEEQYVNLILTGVPPHMHFLREGFALRMEFTVVEPPSIIVFSS